MTFALKGLVTEIDCLSEPQRRRVAAAAAAMKDPKQSGGKLLAALGPAIDHLSKPDCERIFRIAMVRLGDGENKTVATMLAGLATTMDHWSEVQKERIVTTAISLKDESARAKALGGLGARMADLTEAQQERVVAAARSVSMTLRHPGSLIYCAGLSVLG